MDSGERAVLTLTGWLGWEIGGPTAAGEIQMTTTGPLDEGQFENIIDLTPLEARAIASALVALADYLDRNEHANGPHETRQTVS